MSIPSTLDRFARTTCALIVIALATLALPATAAQARTRSCPALSSSIGAISVTGVSCATAGQVIRGDISGTKRPRGFVCHAKAYPGGARVTCSRGKQRVRYSLAD